MSELLATVEEILTPYLGVAAAVGDNSHYVTAALEHFCYGMAIPSAEDIGYCLPTEVMQRIEQQCTNALLTAISAGFGIVWPCRSYGFSVSGDDVIVEEASESHLPISRHDGIPQPLQTHVENGDFVPERLRR